MTAKPKDREGDRRALRARIASLEDAIRKATEYLETGNHADWHGFRALFAQKHRDGKTLPPHKDWVRNHFLPSKEKALDRAERLLERLEE